MREVKESFGERYHERIEKVDVLAGREGAIDPTEMSSIESIAKQTFSPKVQKRSREPIKATKDFTGSPKIGKIRLST